jgi:hypothetical protein
MLGNDGRGPPAKSSGAGTTIAGSVPLDVDLPQHQAPTTTVDDVIPV